MSTLPQRTEPAAVRDPDLRRDPARKAIAGVAGGLSRHLGVPVAWLRVAFVLLAFLDGLGVMLYAALWVFVPARTSEEAAGLEAASRAGMRPQRRAVPFDASILFSVGVIVVGIGWVLATGGMFIPARVFWPVVLGGVGVVMVWLQADRALEPSSRVRDGSLLDRLTRGSGLASVLRLLGGLVLVGLGTWWILATQIGLDQLPPVLASAAVLLAGLLVVAAPWLYRLRTRVRVADEERLRAEARADMAAHLHDSVLQTLALIQRQAADAPAVASLARRQERELRTWLYGEAAAPQTLRGALEQVRAEVEQNFTVAVEVVCVGDMDLGDSTRAIVQATREAAMNAAKHSGADRVDVYAEVEPERVEVFVRDRGAGFDLQEIGTDRMGVKQSIHARMERHGGMARIRTAPGEGTEVRLEMSR